MKIACIGAGGRYFSRPIRDFAATAELHGCDIFLFDIDFDRAALMADFGRRMSKECNSHQRIKVATTLEEAIDGADFVLASIGGAGASGNAGYYESPVHLGDNVICSEFGIPQVIGDTCGPSAMMAAFRSVPIYLNICRKIEKHAPNAVMLNHANPMAILCLAMRKYSSVKSVIGICHGVQGGIKIAADILDIPPKELETTWVGTNHYYWFTGMFHKGKNIQPIFWEQVKNAPIKPGRQMSYELSHLFKHWIVYPEDDHIIEFFPFAAQIRDASNLPYNMSEYGYGKRMRSLYAGTESIEEIKKADNHEGSAASALAEMKRTLSEITAPAGPESGLLAEGTGQLLADIAGGRRRVHICNIPNQGAVPNLPHDAILEVEAVTDSRGVRPIYMDQAPPILEVQLRKRLLWQELVAEAAVKGDKQLATQAMMVDECAIIPSQTEKLLQRLLKNSEGLLPTFEKRITF